MVLGQLIAWITANPGLFLGINLVAAVILSGSRVQMMIPGVRELNAIVSGYTFPIVGRLTLPGLLIVGSSVIFLLIDGSFSKTIATGIGFAVILSALRDDINIFVGPG